MWKLAMMDADGDFHTWEPGETCAEAMQVAKARRGRSVRNVRPVIDHGGNPVSEMAPVSGPERHQWNLRHLAQK